MGTYIFVSDLSCDVSPGIDFFHYPPANYFILFVNIDTEQSQEDAYRHKHEPEPTKNAPKPTTFSSIRHGLHIGSFTCLTIASPAAAAGGAGKARRLRQQAA
jgi:hypothetical protein